jgi:hypothetical protein
MTPAAYVPNGAPFLLVDLGCAIRYDPKPET